MDIVFLTLLILLNGLFAMSEIAVVSSRKVRLQALADNGDLGATAALALHDQPSSFLSTIQVGITTIGILSGAVGENLLAEPLAAQLASIPLLAPHAKTVALAVVVVLLTYFSVVVGELVPKRLALLAPEGIAALVARPMLLLSQLAKPVVVVLSRSGDMILRAFGARRSGEPPVTDEEIKVLMEQGAEAGVFHESEQEIVSNVLRLDEQRVGAILTPRMDIYAIDLTATDDELRRAVAESVHHRVVVCRDGLENVVGILRIGDLLKHSLAGELITGRTIAAAVHEPLYLPETLTTTQLLENFRSSRTQLALIVDEYGDLQGLVTLTDVLTSIVGEVSLPERPEEQDIVRREDGSWLVDGSVTLERLKSVLDIEEELPGEEERHFNTLGGFVMSMLGRIPVVPDSFECVGLRFEVVDMDRNRVDRVLVSRPAPTAGAPAPERR
jgi:putative hemolysin